MKRASGLLAGAACLLAAFLVAAAFIARSQGFGAGDLTAFLFWTIPFSILMVPISYALNKLVGRFRLPISLLLAAVVGVLSGVLWTMVVALFLGPWMGAFSFPVVSCWVAAGASGMVAGIVAASNRSPVSALAGLVLASSVCFAAVVGTDPLFIWLSNDQRLKVITYRLTPSADQISFGGGVSDYDLTNEEQSKLKSLIMNGRLEFTGGGVYGSGANASRVIIVMQRQLDTPSVDFPQPDRANAIYLQGRDGKWTTYPSDVRTLKRKIILEVPQHKPSATSLWVELAGGGKQGNEAFDW